jgi:hypothetical protein
MSDVTIRPFQPGDRARVREICRASNPFEDEEVIPTLFADYYMDCEPELCMVAEADGHVIGYALGGTGSKMKRWLRRVLPGLTLRVAWKLVSFQYRRRETYRTLWCFVAEICRLRDPLRPSPDRYPVECHFQVWPGYKNLRLVPMLLVAFGTRLMAMGIPGVWGGVLEEEGDERLTQYLRRKFGCNLLGSRKMSLINPATGRKMFLRVLARKLTN